MMNIINEPAPIIVFVYNRPEHTKKTIDALKENILAQESNLFIFSDGPKTGEEKKVKEVRNYLKEITGFKNIRIIEREENLGLAQSVILGVTDVVSQYGKVIVLEDDIICTQYFLLYMNTALKKYEENKKVYSVSGYSYLKERYKGNIPDTYFLNIISSWSWGTWADRWEWFEASAKGYQRLRWDFFLRRKFNYDNTCNYYTMIIRQMMQKKQKNGKKIDSWAIRWYWTCFKNNGVNLYPRDSFVENIGFDGSGVHCGKKTTNISLNSKDLFKTSFEFSELIEEKRWIRSRVKKSLKERD